MFVSVVPVLSVGVPREMPVYSQNSHIIIIMTHIATVSIYEYTFPWEEATLSRRNFLEYYSTVVQFNSLAQAKATGLSEGKLVVYST